MPANDELMSCAALDIGHAAARGGGPRILFRGLNLRLHAGELVCLMGPNGAGKSTLMKTLCGLLPPLGGSVHVAGRDLGTYRGRELARVLGAVWTERIHVEYLTVRDVVSFGRYPHRVAWGGLSAADNEAIISAIDAMEIAGLLDLDFSNLSDGEKQRVLMARALCQESAVLILDEPLAFLDLGHRIHSMRLLLKWARERGRAVLLSTHDFNLTLQMADHVWLMDAVGRFHSGAPEDLMLGGQFNSAFGSDEVEIDAASGDIRLRHERCTSLFLEGTGPAKTWTERALLKRGYGISAEAQCGIRISHGARIFWTFIDGDGLQSDYDTIETLMRGISNRRKNV